MDNFYFTQIFRMANYRHARFVDTVHHKIPLVKLNYWLFGISLN